MLGVRPTVRATLAADHRVSDGHEGSRFLATIDRPAPSTGGTCDDRRRPTPCSARCCTASPPRSTSTRSTPDAPLQEAIDLDSMDFLNLVTALHEETGIDVPERDYPSLSTVAGFVAYMAAATAA